MKKTLLSLAVLVFMGSTVTFAQENRKSLKKHDKTEQTAKDPADVMKFHEEVYDFGTIQEGDKAEHVFTFQNKSKKPITIQNVSTTCGCTSPAWSKEPVAPKKKGSVTVSYRTHVGPINRQVTVMTDQGNKVLKIVGTVVAKPATSVPEGNSAVKGH